MAATRRRRKEPAPGWAWMLFGLAIGLAVALVVYLQSGDSGGLRLPSAVASLGQAVRAERAATPSQQSPPAVRDAPAAASESEPDPESTGDELSFYEALANAGVDVPESGAVARVAAALPSWYMIQAGSFRTYGEADSRRAQLTLLAVDAGIQQARVNGSIYYRVMIGPLGEREEINRTLRQLGSAQIEYILKPVTD